ncbi:hypothetical protein MASR1M65_08810 [Saprospiraceae bacterium]
MEFCEEEEDMKTYIYGLLSGYSLRRNASECGISLNTSFIWRHKLLRCFDNMSAGEYAGILEIDELFFHYHKKVVVSCPEQGAPGDQEAKARNQPRTSSGNSHS